LLIIGKTARFSGSNTASVSGAFSRVADGGEGQSGNVRIVAANLAVIDGAQLTANTAGLGNAGNIVLEISERAQFSGRSAIDGEAGGVFSNVRPTGEGQSGNISIRAANLDLAGQCREYSADG
jgi:hypothetical protein